MIKYTYVNRLENEGAGSLLQRELFASFAAQIMGFGFVGYPNKLTLGHEPEYISLEKLNADWGLIRKIIGSYEDINQFDLKNLIHVDSIKSLKALVREHASTDHLMLLSINFNVAHNLFVDQPSYIQREIVDKFRERLQENPMFNERDYIALHIRCASKADVVFGLDTLPWQHFNIDYGIHNNNPNFYIRLYYGVLRKIIRNSTKMERIKLRIYSTCSKIELQVFAESLADEFDVQLVIGGYSYQDFIEMASARLLISAHSSFSWLALFFNPNTTYIRSGFRHILPYNTTTFSDSIADNYTIKDVFLTVIGNVKNLFYKANKLILKVLNERTWNR